MNKTYEHSGGVQGILRRARRYNPEIGNYIEHFINERFSFTVRLSNGRIEMPMEAAQDQETMPSSISEESILEISKNFQNNTPIQITSIQAQNITIPRLSFWQKIKKILGIK